MFIWANQSKQITLVGGGLPGTQSNQHSLWSDMFKYVNVISSWST